MGNYVAAYTADFNMHLTAYHPAKAQRTTLAQEVAWLRSLLPIEEASARRARDAGIFDGLRRTDVDNAARGAVRHDEIIFRRGWLELFSQVFRHNALLHTEVSAAEIVSVNWSTWFIKCCVAHAAAESDIVGPPPGRGLEWEELASYSQVTANEIQSIAAEIAASDLSVRPTGPIRTSSDKLNVVNASRKRYEQEKVLPILIYIGDSCTDLECLLAANVGICIRDETMGSGQQELAETCGRLGTRMKNIGECEYVRLERPVEEELNVLWWARDFEEVDVWLTRHCNQQHEEEEFP